MRVDSWCDTQLECCYSPQGLRSVYSPSVATRALSLVLTARKYTHTRAINKLTHVLFYALLLSLVMYCESLFSVGRHYNACACLWMS